MHTCAVSLLMWLNKRYVQERKQFKRLDKKVVDALHATIPGSVASMAGIPNARSALPADVMASAGAAGTSGMPPVPGAFMASAQSAAASAGFISQIPGTAQPGESAVYCWAFAGVGSWQGLDGWWGKLYVG